jgi:Acetyltransferase (GNAT) domain
MTIAIDWNTLSIDEWETYFSQIPFSNFLQSYDYARAAAPILKQKPRWGLIRIKGQPAGIVQMFEAGILWNALHAVMIDRGPLWFPGFGGALHIKLFFDEINRQFPQRFGRRRRFLPEIEDGLTAQKLIVQTGLQASGNTGYETIWVDLQPEEEELRSNLKSNWRNKLNKAEKADLSVGKSDDIDWASGIYAADKTAREYKGISPEMLRIYATFLSPKNDLLLLRATKDGNPVAFTMTVRHGRSATYLVGWSSEQGREHAAHHLLLWQSMLYWKQQGVKEFDLGGINDEGAAGVKTFKEGLGGRSVRYLGQYH